MKKKLQVTMQYNDDDLQLISQLAKVAARNGVEGANDLLFKTETMIASREERREALTELTQMSQDLPGGYS